jgi:hypothetical protein
MWIELGGTVISEGILWGEGLKPTKKKHRERHCMLGSIIANNHMRWF